MGDTGGAGSGPGGGSGTGPGRVMAFLGAPFSRLAAALSAPDCEQGSQLIEVTRAYTVTAGTYGYEPAVQGVLMGNLSPARRGRGGK